MDSNGTDRVFLIRQLSMNGGPLLALSNLQHHLQTRLDLLHDGI